MNHWKQREELFNKAQVCIVEGTESKNVLYKLLLCLTDTACEYRIRHGDKIDPKNDWSSLFKFEETCPKDVIPETCADIVTQGERGAKFVTRA